MRKQLDPRIPILINNNVQKNHRSFIVLVGDKGRDQARRLLFLSFSYLTTAVDRESSLPAIPGTSISPPFSSMVLQKGAGVYQVRSFSVAGVGGVFCLPLSVVIGRNEKPKSKETSNEESERQMNKILSKYSLL
jgi:hypothetical protein